MRSQHIMEFPTLKLFLDGKEHHYTGGRTRTHIVNWVNERLNREVSMSSHAQIENSIEAHSNDVVVIGALGSDPSIKEEFVRIARLFDTSIFIDVETPDLLNKVIEFHDQQHILEGYPLKDSPSVMLINPHKDPPGVKLHFESRIVRFKGSLAPAPSSADQPDSDPVVPTAQLELFVRQFLFPSTAMFTKDVAQYLFSDGRPIVVLVVKTNLNHASQPVNAARRDVLLQSFRQVANDRRGSLLFTIAGLDSMYERRLLSLLSVEEEDVPTMRIISFNPKGSHHYHPTLTFVADAAVTEGQNEAATVKEMQSFVTKFIAGQLKPSLRSEVAPQPEDNMGPVKIVVGSTFEEFVTDNKRDVFMMFYAPWCGHCRKLEPALRMLGEKISYSPKVKEHLLIAKFDATRNEAPNLSFSGYPTLLLFRGDKDVGPPVQFSQTRSVEEMLKFISQYATHRFDYEAVLAEAAKAKSSGGAAERSALGDLEVDDVDLSAKRGKPGKPDEPQRGYERDHRLSIYEEL
eukprot:Selendium_serpulae@DN1910_c0_g1_i1.p1